MVISFFIINKLKKFAIKHPLLKDMLAFGSLLPFGNFVQENIEGQRPGNYDWKRTLRYGIFGCFFSAPLLYNWVRFIGVMWPETNFRIGITKAIVEQLTYGPFMNVFFFFTMSIMEGRTSKQSLDEVKLKFLPTYKVGFVFWPTVQAINYSVIRQQNRVVFVSVTEVIWTIFLAYMKELKNNKFSEN